MSRNKFRVRLILIGVFFVAYFIVTVWSNGKPYAIEDWQIDTQNDDWHISQSVVTNIHKIDDSTISNLARYQTDLIGKAQEKGFGKEEITNVLSIADQQGPKMKMPVYIKTATKDNRDVIIIAYKYGLGWADRLASIKQFIPISKRLDEQWVVVIQTDDDKIIYSDGTM
jgi:hypothetical protein